MRETHKMTQEMADIIGTAHGDPGCAAVTRIFREDQSRAYASELFHCLERGYVVRMDATGAIQGTSHGAAARRRAINSGEVRA